MNPRNKVMALMLVVSMACAVSYALVSVADRGNWPSSWPKELDPLRERSRTIGTAAGNQENLYEIPFHTREEFEQAWPHILTLKSKGAPIILEGSPSTNFLGKVMTAGVRILWPSECEVKVADGAVLKAGPPWPDSARTASGNLPEYVVEEHGQWVPFAGRGGWRARVDIVLVTDGQVVDTNRIEIPAQTRIIDGRVQSCIHVSGGVRVPGRYDWTNGMTVLDGINAAGGFTDSSEWRVKVFHSDGSNESFNRDLLDVTNRPPLLRIGDTISIPKRIF